MASSETIIYNVYHATFTQKPPSPPHYAIALVPAQNLNQNAGRFYHVTGLVGLGMDYECRKGHNFGARPDFKEKVLKFQLPRVYLEEFEKIAEGLNPPCDPRALMEKNPEPPVRDCADWVEELLDETREFLKGKGVDVDGNKVLL